MVVLTGVALGLLWEPGRQQRDDVLAARALLRAFEMRRREAARVEQGLDPLTCGAGDRDCNAALGLSDLGEIQDYTFDVRQEGRSIWIRARPTRSELPPVELSLSANTSEFLP